VYLAIVLGWLRKTMPFVDLRFRIQGKTIPADHAYALFSAISRRIPGVHSDTHIGIHPISGRLVGNRALGITDSSYLTIRTPSDRVAEMLPIAGKKLRLGGAEVLVGVPRQRRGESGNLRRREFSPRRGLRRGQHLGGERG
jgi:CRISPR-associated protein Cas6